MAVDVADILSVSIPGIAISATMLFALRKLSVESISSAISKSIAHRFDLKIEAVKLQNSTSIEEIRASLSHQSNRQLDLTKREADYCLEAWGLLRVAFAHVGDCVSPYQSYEDLNGYDDDTIKAILETLGFNTVRTNLVIESNDRQAMYQRFSDRMRHASAHEHAVTFNMYFMQHRIFISDELTELFDSTAAPMWEALRDQDYQNRFPESRNEEGWKRRSAFSKGYSDLLDPLKAQLRAKFINA